MRDRAGIPMVEVQHDVATARRATRTAASRLGMWGWPAVVTAGLGAGALWPEVVLRDALTRQPVSDATLYLPLGYLVLAPFCQALDALTLLSTRQHVAVVATAVLVLVAFCGTRGWRTLRALAMLVAGMLLIAAVYALCTLVPRPMAAIRVTDPSVVVVDFHSHTNFSWDGRTSFTVERNRAWHRAGGWDVAYVTDHLKLEGAELGVAANPRHAGEGTVLLPGVECRTNGLHLLVLGMTAAGLATLRTDVESGGTRLRDERDHTVIHTIPGNLGRMARRSRTRPGTPVGIEASDAGPHGLDQMQRQREEVMAIAQRRNFALVAGSNNHGWSSTPAAWSLLRIPGWRDLTPEALGVRIEALLRQEGFRAVRVVERHGADADATRLGLAATAPAVAWHVLATLTPAERLSWLVWTWGLALAGCWWRRRH